MKRTDMDSLVTCKYCGHGEKYGEMRWLNGREQCKECYKKDFEKTFGIKYEWNDLEE